MDVSINAQAITVENGAAADHVVVPSVLESRGLGAAFVLSLAMNYGLPLPPYARHGRAAFPSHANNLGCLLPDAPTRAERAAGFSWPDAKLIRLGALAFSRLSAKVPSTGVRSCAQRNRRLGGDGTDSICGFRAVMASGRFLGDVLIARLGPVLMLRISGALMALGLRRRSWCKPGRPRYWVSRQWLRHCKPRADSFGAAAGRIKRRRPGLATVTTLGYFGFLSGPPFIGALAAVAGLPFAFVTVIVFGATIATLGVSIVRRSLSESSRRADSPGEDLKLPGALSS